MLGFTLSGRGGVTSNNKTIRSSYSLFVYFLLLLIGQIDYKFFCLCITCCRNNLTWRKKSPYISTLSLCWILFFGARFFRFSFVFCWNVCFCCCSYCRGWVNGIVKFLFTFKGKEDEIASGYSRKENDDDVDSDEEEWEMSRGAFDAIQEIQDEFDDEWNCIVCFIVRKKFFKSKMSFFVLLFSNYLRLWIYFKSYQTRFLNFFPNFEASAKLNAREIFFNWLPAKLNSREN